MGCSSGQYAKGACGSHALAHNFAVDDHSTKVRVFRSDAERKEIDTKQWRQRVSNVVAKCGSHGFRGFKRHPVTYFRSTSFPPGKAVR